MTRSVPENFDLQRFLDAQARVYADVLRELRQGRKQSHWMWFIFPQIVGLGSSPSARTYAIESLAEAKAYLRHPVLGKRLDECTRLVNAIADTSALDIFGTPDDLKFRSSMTLFAEAAEDASPFRTALDHFCAGQADERTLRILRR